MCENFMLLGQRNQTLQPFMSLDNADCVKICIIFIKLCSVLSIKGIIKEHLPGAAACGRTDKTYIRVKNYELQHMCTEDAKSE